uniref:tRNA threonylcarbamoyladenosine biosynthesis protein TsaE n=1 Tax=Magnetococcus massalia (strain MO-1) TaxID=451514 RepID=A0A1S7LFC5_MAGMO|nr:Conserved protein of unknown function [Candidatus Magnetococcus massalia]
MFFCQFTSRSEAETEAVAAALARAVQEPVVICLEGDLGAGKTAFSRGFVHGMALDEAAAQVAVTSPTFAIMQPYEEGRLPVYHFDLYRLHGPEDLEAIGADDLLDNPDGVLLVEWPERAADWFPKDRLMIQLTIHSDQQRHIAMGAGGPRTTQLLQSLQSESNA